MRKRGELVLLPGIAVAAKRLGDAGFALVIATNQEFVGSGYIAREEHEAIMTEVVRELESAGARVDAVYACLHPRGSGCHDAKPKPGMLLDAARDLGLDLSRSFMVGDNAKDMLAGRRAGARTVLVDPRFRTRIQRAAKHADHVARDLPAAAEWIVAQPGAQ